ncbi:MAG TPA: CBS domain-containing protein [Thermoguttaceae bacterium]|nr:CBS domain-containing protein [Thermoguttaceae bacterium]
MNRIELKQRQVCEALARTQTRFGRTNLTVGRVMTAGPYCVRPETTALELVKLFHAKQFRHLMVTDEADCLVGVVSDRDVIRCLGPESRPDHDVLEGISAGEIMSTDLVTVGPDTPLERAVSLMLEEGISSLPVLAGGTLVGILTNTDLHVVLQQMLLQTLRQSRSEKPGKAGAFNPQD